VSPLRVLVFAAVLGGIFLTGCRSQSPAPPAISTPAPSPVLLASTGGPPFNAGEAFDMLQAQCDMGPRKPGTAPHKTCRAYIVKELAPYADKVIQTHWTWTDEARHVTLPFTNILAVFNPTAKRTVMLFTHWDTRPTADQELDPVNKQKPILGADDGASGTATLLELARVFHAQKPNIRVELLFVDGEDWGPNDDKMYLGAIHFAENPGLYKPDYAILLDMIGAKDLLVYREISSQQLHPDLNDKVWQDAAELGYPGNFPNLTKWQISDDHDTFNAHGIPAIDLIDFDYAFWHTLQDTPDKCSPQSLLAVGSVCEKVIYDEK
jgi:glutaminyl-peptide cyclotransferase